MNANMTDSSSGLSEEELSRTCRVLDIIRGTTVDGPGFRTSIYLAGCPHHCPGCHNPQSWDAGGGREISIRELLEIVKEEEFDVTLSGGDPLMHPDTTALLAKGISLMGHKVWVYTGYTIEEIRRTPALHPPLQWVEAIVDGPFIESLKDPDLLFRGSANQRIITKDRFFL